jgi:hypothetical protein
LREANDRISNTIAKLPIFRHCALGDALHSNLRGHCFAGSSTLTSPDKKVPLTEEKRITRR